MRDSMRLYATLVIWLSFVVLTTLLLTLPSSVFATGSATVAVITLIVLAITASISTMAVWDALDDDETPTEQDSAAARAKQKRAQRARMERLIEELPDDDIYELEALLLAREQEAEANQSRH